MTWLRIALPVEQPHYMLRYLGLVVLVILSLVTGGSMIWLVALGCGPAGFITPMNTVMMLMSSLSFAIVGTLITLFRPRNRIGWIALGIAFLLPLSAVVAMFGACDVVAPYRTSTFLYIAWFWYTSDGLFLLLMFVYFPMLYPTGHFLSKRWKRATGTGVALLLLARTAMAVLPDFRGDSGFGATFDLDNPFGITSLPVWWHSFFRVSSLVIVCALCFLGIVAIHVRLRRSRGDERQQMKWLAYFLVTAVVVQLVVFEIPGGLFYPQIFFTVWYELILFVVFVGFPLVIGIAIFKYHLYEIDLLINRTLVYGALTALVVALYILIVSGLGLLFHNENNVAASLVATGIIAIIFQPVKSRLQSTVNRWLFGDRDDPATVLTRLTTWMDTAESDESLISSLVETIAFSLKLPYVALWLRSPDGSFTLAAESGVAQKQTASIPLRHSHETIGRMVVAPRSPRESLSPADESLLDAIARLTATTARTIQLSDEVQAARVRTVSAREEERRRLRRDLHDGLGPMLASQGLKLAAARQLVRTRPELAETLLDEVVGQNECTVTEVRQLVYGLRPPTLDELGLIEAIREHVNAIEGAGGTQITVAAPDHAPPIPAAIEVAAFRIVQEALNNVIRHAQAQHCTVALSVDQNLRIRIEDDGIGLPAQLKTGVGMLSMRERAAEVNGVCTIETGTSKTGKPGGVVVTITLPLPS